MGICMILLLLFERGSCTHLLTAKISIIPIVHVLGFLLSLTSHLSLSLTHIYIIIQKIIARFSITPTPKVNLCDWPSFNGTGFDHFPQLKFFDLHAYDLEAMDEGLTFQQKEATRDDEEEVTASSPHPPPPPGAAADVESKSTGSKSPSSQSQSKSKGWTLGTAKSDPYCVIHTSPPQLKAAASDIKTETIMQALSPTWISEPVLSLKVAQAEPLRNASFQITVLDYDALNADDVIGSADFTFEEVIANKDANGIYSFERDCVFKGNIRGTICGKIEVNLPNFDGTFPHKGRCIDDKRLTLVPKPASCCTIS
jgi:hypothetical protein